MGIRSRAMEIKAVLFLAALCVCSGFNVFEDGPTALPSLEDEAPAKVEPALKADQSFQAAQEALKQAAAIPDPSPDSYGLEEAQEAAKAEAFNEQASQQSLGDSMLLGESFSDSKTKKKHSHIDALMGKMIMSDMFSPKELEQTKAALDAQGKQQLGESSTVTDPDHVALAKGLSLALGAKTKAEDQVQALERTVGRMKKNHSARVQKTAANLSGCQERVKSVQAESKGMQSKVTHMNAELAKATTRHKISARGHELCEQRAASAEAAMSHLKSEAMDFATKAMAKKPIAPIKKAAASAPQVVVKMSAAKSSNLSPCCQTCARLSQTEIAHLKADCSGC